MVFVAQFIYTVRRASNQNFITTLTLPYFYAWLRFISTALFFLLILPIPIHLQIRITIRIRISIRIRIHLRICIYRT